MIDYNDGKWHGWSGSCSQPDSIHDESIIEYVWHDTNTNECGICARKAGEDEEETSPAWVNILKFRVIKEHKYLPNPREFWIDLIDMVATQEPCHANSYFIKVREVLE